MVTIEKEYLEYLDDLRESGATNMYGAAKYLQTSFPELTMSEAREVLTYWMKTFEERHPR